MTHPKVEMTIRPYQSPDRSWVFEENVRFYQDAHGFDDMFRVAVADALDLLEESASDGSTYLIAEVDHQRAGCIFLSREMDTVGRIRLLFLREEQRGHGIGRHLLTTALADARNNSIGIVRVSTFDRHPEACGLYNAFGFTLVKTTPVVAFGHSMNQLDFELRLDAS